MELLTFLLMGLVAVLFFLGLAMKPSQSFMRSLKQKHVLVTGGTSGIGFAIAKQALADGAFVTLVSRSSSNLKKASEKLVDEIHCNADRIQCQVADVGDYNAISRAIKESLLWRPIDVLVCNAGLTRGGYLGEYGVEEVDLTVRTNILGTIYPLHAALPSMKQRSSPHHPTCVVIISSLASLFSLYGHSVYTATKYAVRGLAEALRLELLPYGVKVNLICPGFVKTPFLDDAEKEQHVAEVMRKVNHYDRNSADTPQSVANCTLGAVRRGDFLVPTQQPAGFLLSTVGRGVFAADSLCSFIVEAVGFFFVRLVWLVYSAAIRREILQNHKLSQIVKK